MPMYEVEWTEVKRHRSLVLVPSDEKALEGAKNIDDIFREPEIVTWVKKDGNPIIAGGPTEITVTALGRVTPEGTVPL